ncbi:MAG: hypothetical protein AB8F95_11760 [Bacteroidia bacterium]
MRTFFFCFLLIFTNFLAAQSILPDDISKAKDERNLRLDKLDRLSLSEQLALGSWEFAFLEKSVTEMTTPERLAAVEYYMLQNDFSKAKEVLEGLSTLEPEVVLLQARLLIESWELDDAEAALKSIEHRLPEARFWLGRLQLLRKQYSAALPYARDLRMRDHEPALGYLLQAEAQLWLRNLPEAEEALKRSLELNPFSADARFWYGYVIWRKGDATRLDDMAAQWEFALTLNPLHYLTHWHWGNGHTHLTFEDYQDEAEEEILDKLLPAEKAFSQGNFNYAFAILDRVSRHHPTSVITDMHRASYWYMAFDEADHLDSAEVVFQRILEKKPHYGPAHNGLAAVIKAKRFPFLAEYTSLQKGLSKLPDDNALRAQFFSIFPDMSVYPGDQVQRMILEQLHAGKAYFPLLEKQGRRFVIPPLHKDLAVAMNNTWFRRGVTFDNRQWMDIRGVGSGATGIEYVLRGAHLERNVTLHEYVHLFHMTCFSDQEKRRLRQLYAHAMKESHTLDYYSANNEHEYLAQTYTAYFAQTKVHPLNHKSVNTRNDLETKDHDLFVWIDSLVQRQEAFMGGDQTAFNENWAAVYVSLAGKNVQQGSNRQASALLDTAMRWSSDYLPAHALKVDILIKEDELEKAAKSLSALADRLGAHPILLRSAASVSHAGGNVEQMGTFNLDSEIHGEIFWLKKAYQLEDDFAEKAQLQKSLREALYEDLKWQEAISLSQGYADSLDAFSTYLRDRKREAQIFALEVKSEMGDSSGLVRLAKFLEQRPQDEALRISYAKALAAAGHYEQAIEILKKGMTLVEASGGYSNGFVKYIALYTAQAGDIEQARRLSERMGEKSESLFVRLNLLLNEPAQAEAIWKRLPEVSALNKLNKAWLKVDLLELKGKRKEARKARKQAEKLGARRV